MSCQGFNDSQTWSQYHILLPQAVVIQLHCETNTWLAERLKQRNRLCLQSISMCLLEISAKMSSHINYVKHLHHLVKFR